MGIRSLILVLSFLTYLTFNSHSEEEPLKRLLESKDINPQQLLISIDKSDYRLMIQSGGEVIKSYPVVFGANPVDDKLMEGDQCTPEGEFKVRAYYPHQSWSKFIWIDYPNEQSWEKHNEAKYNGTLHENAKIGGEIGIHGVPQGYDYAIKQQINWTLGCISMTNKDIEVICPYIYEGMKVNITK